MNLLYYFKHELNGVPRVLSVAFDRKYNSIMTRNTKYLGDLFSQELIYKIGLQSSACLITPYWPETCRIVWSKADKDNEYISEVNNMKVLKGFNAGKTIGCNIKERWHIDVANKCISSVEDI